MSSQSTPLTHLHPSLRSLATRADRARDTVARLTQVLGADPLNDPTRMAMFPWPVFLEQYNTAIHQLADLSTYLSSPDSPFDRLFIHPAHALTPAEQSSLYGGPNATLDPPLRPVPGKLYADDRAAAYAQLADDLTRLETNRNQEESQLDGAYTRLAQTSSDLRTTDEQVNFHLLESARAVEGVEGSLKRVEALREQLQVRQGRARQVVDSLRAGFEWDARLDKEYSVVREAEEKGVEDASDEDDEDDAESDAEGSDDVVPAQTVNPSVAGSRASEVIDLDDDDDDLFGENDSSAVATPAAAPGKEEDEDEDEEMEEVA